MNGTYESMNIWRVVCALALMVGSLAMTSTASADATTNKSANYTEECITKGVPLPPVWGEEFGFWKYAGQLSTSEVFTGTPTPTDIYYFLSAPKNADGSTNQDWGNANLAGELRLGGANPEGVCMAAIRKAPNTHTCGGVSGLNYSESFGVICQGKNGNTCFWALKPGNTIPWSQDNPGRALLPPYTSGFQQPAGKGSGPQCYKVSAYPEGKLTDWKNNVNRQTFDLYIVQRGSDSEGIFDNRTETNSFPTWVGGASLVGNKEGPCTVCHAGENMFINHPGTATDINPLSAGRKTSTIPLSHYFPTTWPNPIIPSLDANTGNLPWPQNPAPPSHYNAHFSSSACFTCHAKGQQGGRFPKIADLSNFNNEHNYCQRVLYPSITRTGSNNGAMPPGAGSRAYDTDSFSKAMWDNLCTTGKTPRSAENGVNTARDFYTSKIHKSSFQSGPHEHSFTGKYMPSESTVFDAKDRICVDGFVSHTGGQTPEQIMLQFYAPNGGGDWAHRAFWGANKIGPAWGLPAVGRPENFQAGTRVTPKGIGYWTPYCVTAGSVGLDRKYITGISFALYGGSMWWGNVYRYKKGVGIPETLFTTPLDLPRSASGGDFWNVVSTPAWMYWNPASWSPYTFGAGSEGSYGTPDQFGNVNLGAYKDNYCYVNSLAHKGGDRISLEIKGQGGEWWSLGSDFSATQSMIGANCFPWREMVSSTIRNQTTIPPTLNSGIQSAWNNTGGAGSRNPDPPTVLAGGSPATNLCVLNGLNGSFSTTGWSYLTVWGAGWSDNGASAWYWDNQTPKGRTTCANVGMDKLSPAPASAFTRGKVTWHHLNQNWSGSGGSIDISALSGSGKDANNQFCYLAGVEPYAATGTPSVYLAVADGTSTYTNSSGGIIPAGRWIVWGQGGMSYVRVGCQSVPI